jgi:hypothetical protein
MPGTRCKPRGFTLLRPCWNTGKIPPRNGTIGVPPNYVLEGELPGHIRDLRKRKGGYKGRNYWQARWTNPEDPSDTKEKGFHTKAEAEVWIEDRNNAARSGTLINDRSAKRSVATVAAEWQASRVRQGPKTRIGHDSILHAHVLP